LKFFEIIFEIFLEFFFWNFFRENVECSGATSELSLIKNKKKNSKKREISSPWSFASKRLNNPTQVPPSR
jgi:hypothetical protein